MTDIDDIRKGLEWILEGDKFGFGTNWDTGEPQCEEERAGKIIWNAIKLLKIMKAEQERRANNGAFD